MKVLGIYDGHTATAALLEDGKILSVISEERLNREKEWLGFPRKSIEKVLEMNNTSIGELDKVIVCGLLGSTTYQDFVNQTFQPLVTGFNIFKSIVPRNIVKKNGWPGIVTKMAAPLRKKKEIFSFFDEKGYDRNKIEFIDHHLCHAYTTFTNTWGQKDDMLILTLDAAGDCYSGSVNVVKNGEFKTIERTNVFNSLGLLYSRLTQYLGMRPLSHEYKVMGLAAYTKDEDSQKIYDVFRTKFMRIDPENPLRLENLSGAVGADYLKKFDKHFKNTRFDHLAGGGQKLVEELIVQWTTNAIQATGIKNVFCSGGVFMNVKANMRTIYKNVADRFFVFPSCGDESNAIGACNYGYRQLCQEKGIDFQPHKLMDYYFGNEFGEKETEEAIKKNEGVLKAVRIDDINKHVASLLAKGEIVARCSGKMEFGARALGNRSILGHPNKTGVTREINDAIKQRDFWMPFACSMLDKFEKDYLVNPAEVPSNYMILSFAGTQKAHEHLINGMHQYDLTVRPQVVLKEHNADYYEIIEHFHSLTGIGGILNTSFNIHGEPIACTPDDAISTLLRSGLKHLVIGNYYLTKTGDNKSNGRIKLEQSVKEILSDTEVEKQLM
jgi:carbamoyltransferase